MTRVNFHDEDGILRWFDDEATREDIPEGRNWNGNNWIGACSGLQTNRAYLYLTKGGRWIEHQDARNEFNGANSYRYLTEEEARQWLIRAADAGRDGEDAEKALERLFPDMPEESGPEADGPSKGGRPRVGPPISVAFPEELLARIDEAAKKEKISRAEWLRRVADANA
ncbi:CopG family transcriptional regulator [Streptomyces capuensis]|uniref:ribbon-helix-helix domain-containing protein n=1 Tax=Streptomyces capuensis TaxID=1464056 RepID=UPI000518892A|nr:CopG family transcriptional regulator [Streptomyces capuensis]